MFPRKTVFPLSTFTTLKESAPVSGMTAVFNACGYIVHGLSLMREDTQLGNTTHTDNVNKNTVLFIATPFK